MYYRRSDRDRDWSGAAGSDLRVAGLSDAPALASVTDARAGAQPLCDEFTRECPEDSRRVARSEVNNSALKRTRSHQWMTCTAEGLIQREIGA